MAIIHSGSDSDLIFLASVLRAGGVVAVPTETVYGLAANAFNADACRRIFEIKGRPAHDPLIVHTASRIAADSVAQFNVLADELAPRFWPGPLTMVLRKRPLVPGIVTSDRATVAVRVPAHPLFRALLERSGLALAAPSANPFGYVSPTSAAHVQDSLGHAIDHILDGGPCAVGVESTILDATNPHDPVILRVGQPILLRLKSDLIPLVQAALAGRLDQVEAQWDARPALGVVMAAGGYPGAYRKGDVIHGLPSLPQADCKVFHAGTRLHNGEILSDGGRVLCVTALGEHVADAQRRAYATAGGITWDGVQYRRDIGYRAIAREHQR